MQRRKTDPGQSPLPADIRVLIVDDDDAYRTYLRVLVRRLGCTVVVACDGADALLRLGDGCFDLILSDLEMPKLDGLDLITHVRAHPTASAIYAVMITSREDIQSKIAALTRGFDDFLPKSCADEEVAARIATARRIVARQRKLDAEVLRWRMLATRDELTNVSSRRALEESAREQLARHHEVGVILLDLDHFKSINDTYGHLVGDRVLRDVAALLLSRTRSEDVIARYGGDEFIFMASEVSLMEAVLLASRLTEEVAALRWLLGTDTLQVRITAGIAHSSLLQSPALEPLIDAADRDLYAKKWLKQHPDSPERSEAVYGYPAGAGEVVRLPEAARVELKRERN